MSGEYEFSDESLERDVDIASHVLSRFIECDSYKNSVKDMWKEIEAFRYSTDTNNPLMGGSSFDHTTHIPVAAAIAQDLEAIIGQVVMPHDDWFNFRPQDRASAKKVVREKVLAFLKNRHKLSNFKKELRKLVSDYVTYGNAFAIVEFANETTERKAGYIGPKMGRISPYDIVFNPTASDFNKTPKIIRSLISIGELVRWKEQGLVKEEAVAEILEDRSSSRIRSLTTHDKNQQYVPTGFTNYDAYITSGTVEVLWFYGDIYDSERDLILNSRKIGCIDGKYVIVNEEIDTPTGEPYIFHAGWQVRPDNLWAMGPLDNIIGINFKINHCENAKAEGLDRLIEPDQVRLGDVEEVFDDERGKSIYLAPEGGGVQELAINTQFFQFDLQVDRLEQKARTAARLPLDLVGFRSPGEKTFGEVSALTEGAMRGFIHKAQDFESFLEEILKAELQISAENLSAVIQVPGQIEGGVIPFLDISAKDLAVSGSLIPQGAQRFNRKNQLLSTLTQLSNSNLTQLAGPHISGKAMAKAIEELAELEGFGLIEEFAAIMEQGEAMQVQQQIEQAVAGQAAQPTIQEEMINQELGE